MEFANGPSYNENFTYDKKGNILTLVRTGLADTHNALLI